MWTIIEGDSANTVWTKALSKLSGPELTWVDGRGGATREILHAAIAIKNPRRRWVTSRVPALNPAFALAEVIWIMAGRNDAAFISYFNRSLLRFAGNAEKFHGAYGYRLRSQFGVDQLELAYQSLRANPHSRQVILQIWDPREDLPRHDGSPRDPDIPCNTQSILKIRDGCLEWVQVMRSNDIFLGLPHNLVQFSFIQEILAGWLDVELGHYHHISDSLHIYERDARVINERPPGDCDTGLSFALPKSIFDSSIAELLPLVDLIIDERNTSLKICAAVSNSTMPEPYLNILRVLSAEGLRRREDLNRAEGIMAECSDFAFRQLWANWINRVTKDS